MFPALYSYYQKALEIYTFEHADGAGRAYDLVIQPFIRFITMAIIPVVACALILYVLVSVWKHNCKTTRTPIGVRLGGAFVEPVTPIGGRLGGGLLWNHSNPHRGSSGGAFVEPL